MLEVVRRVEGQHAEACAWGRKEELDRIVGVGRRQRLEPRVTELEEGGCKGGGRIGLRRLRLLDVLHVRLLTCRHAADHEICIGDVAEELAQRADVQRISLKAYISSGTCSAAFVTHPLTEHFQGPAVLRNRRVRLSLGRGYRRSRQNS